MFCSHDGLVGLTACYNYSYTRVLWSLRRMLRILVKTKALWCQVIFAALNKVKFVQSFKSWDTFCHSMDNDLLAYFNEEMQ